MFAVINSKDLFAKAHQLAGPRSQQNRRKRRQSGARREPLQQQHRSRRADAKKDTLEGMIMPGKINNTTKETLRDLLRSGISIDDAAAFFNIDRRSILAVIRGAAAQLPQPQQAPDGAGKEDAEHV